MIETLRLLFPEAEPGPGVLGDLGTVSEVGFGLLGLAMGLGTGNISWPDSGSEECSRPLVDNCPPVTLLGASLELEYPLLSTVST